MAEGSDQEKTEPATPKRREDARKEGNVGTSRDTSSAFLLLAAGGMLYFYGPLMFSKLKSSLVFMLENLASSPPVYGSVYIMLQTVMYIVITTLVPFFIIMIIVGIAANLIQVGFLMSPEILKPKLKKLNPIKGIKKIFSLRGLVELVKSLLKLAIIGVVAYLVIKREIDKIPGLLFMDITASYVYLAKIAIKVFLFGATAFIAIAVADYIYQKWHYEKQLRMTKQEVKDEFKQREGDPKVRARIRRIQMEMARKRMMGDIPGADVVLTNPTHYAVVLKYDPKQMAAPKVVAKGADLIAKKIKDIAFAHSIPIMENKPLAQALFNSVDIGNYIPPELYRAVAEVLAYIFKLNGTKYAK